MPHLFVNRPRQHSLNPKLPEKNQFKWEAINAIVYLVGGIVFIIGSVFFFLGGVFNFVRAYQCNVQHRENSQ